MKEAKMVFNILVVMFCLSKGETSTFTKIDNSEIHNEQPDW